MTVMMMILPIIYNNEKERRDNLTISCSDTLLHIHNTSLQAVSQAGCVAYLTIDSPSLATTQIDKYSLEKTLLLTTDRQYNIIMLILST